MSHRRRPEHGFTLIELLVVITILGILVGVVAVNYGDWVNDSKATKARTELEAFETALKLYKLKHPRYPTTSEGLEKLTEGDKYRPNGWLDTYNENDPWENPYEYESDGRSYRIWSLGADGLEGGEGFDEDIIIDSEGRRD